MNRTGINATEFNADRVNGTVVELGSVVVALSLFQYEHISFDLRGNAVLEWAVFGDLTKSVQIGLAESGLKTASTASLTQYRTILIGAVSSGLGFTESAALTQYRAIGLDAVQAGLAFSASAMLTRLAGLGNASSTMTMNASAGINRRVDLAGSSGVNLTAAPSAGPQRTVMLGASNSSLASTITASLTQYVRRNLPQGLTGMDLAARAELTRFARVMLEPVTVEVGFETSATLQMRVNSMPVQAALTLSANATVVNRVALQGSSSLSVVSTAQLFNNPMGEDVPAMVLVRPFTDRLMVRQ